MEHNQQVSTFIPNSNNQHVDGFNSFKLNHGHHENSYNVDIQNQQHQEIQYQTNKTLKKIPRNSFSSSESRKTFAPSAEFQRLSKLNKQQKQSSSRRRSSGVTSVSGSGSDYDSHDNNSSSNEEGEEENEEKEKEGTTNKKKKECCGCGGTKCADKKKNKEKEIIDNQKRLSSGGLDHNLIDNISNINDNEKEYTRLQYEDQEKLNHHQQQQHQFFNEPFQEKKSNNVISVRHLEW